MKERPWLPFSTTQTAGEEGHDKVKDFSSKRSSMFVRVYYNLALYAAGISRVKYTFLAAELSLLPSIDVLMDGG